MKSRFLEDWGTIVDKGELDVIFKKLHTSDRLEDITPSPYEMFKAFQLCDYNSLKVVIIGQDPYPQRGVATGLAFANRMDVARLSPSLEMLKMSTIGYDRQKEGVIFDPTLESWAKQGVLLLNMALTTEIGKIGAHQLMWRPFITKLIQNLNRDRTGIIYVLYGSEAAIMQKYITVNNDVIVEKHPSWYVRAGLNMPNSAIAQVDTLMKSKYGETIKWFEEYK